MPYHDGSWVPNLLSMMGHRLGWVSRHQKLSLYFNDPSKQCFDLSEVRAVYLPLRAVSWPLIAFYKLPLGSVNWPLHVVYWPWKQSIYPSEQSTDRLESQSSLLTPGISLLTTRREGAPSLRTRSLLTLRLVYWPGLKVVCWPLRAFYWPIRAFYRSLREQSTAPETLKAIFWPLRAVYRSVSVVY